MESRAVSGVAAQAAGLVIFLACGLPAAVSAALPYQGGQADASTSANTGPVRLARFSYVSSNVSRRPDDKAAWAPAVRNLPVRQGAQITAVNGSRAEIQFDDGSRLWMSNGAVVTLRSLYSDADGEFTEIVVNKGTVGLSPTRSIRPGSPVSHAALTRSVYRAAGAPGNLAAVRQARSLGAATGFAARPNTAIRTVPGRAPNTAQRNPTPGRPNAAAVRAANHANPAAPRSPAAAPISPARRSAMQARAALGIRTHATAGNRPSGGVKRTASHAAAPRRVRTSGTPASSPKRNASQVRHNPGPVRTAASHSRRTASASAKHAQSLHRNAAQTHVGAPRVHHTTRSAPRQTRSAQHGVSQARRSAAPARRHSQPRVQRSAPQAQHRGSAERSAPRPQQRSAPPAQHSPQGRSAGVPRPSGSPAGKKKEGSDRRP